MVGLVCNCVNTNTCSVYVTITYNFTLFYQQHNLDTILFNVGYNNCATQLELVIQTKSLQLQLPLINNM